MTDKQFLLYATETEHYTDRSAYISDAVLSSIWGDEETDPIPEDRIESVGKIWDACHRSVKDIASAAGLSQRKLAERFCIPYRTMENWCNDKRECRLYDRLMMQECLGLLHR